MSEVLTPTPKYIYNVSINWDRLTEKKNQVIDIYVKGLIKEKNVFRPKNY